MRKPIPYKKPEEKKPIDKKKILLKETIKTLGTHMIEVKLFDGVNGTIKVNIIG